MIGVDVVAAALSRATEEERQRVRAVLGAERGKHGYCLRQPVIENALKAFDQGNYIHNDIALLLGGFDKLQRSLIGQWPIG